MPTRSCGCGYAVVKTATANPHFLQRCKQNHWKYHQNHPEEHDTCIEAGLTVSINSTTNSSAMPTGTYFDMWFGPVLVAFFVTFAPTKRLTSAHKLTLALTYRLTYAQTPTDRCSQAETNYHSSNWSDIKTGVLTSKCCDMFWHVFRRKDSDILWDVLWHNYANVDWHMFRHVLSNSGLKHMLIFHLHAFATLQMAEKPCSSRSK